MDYKIAILITTFLRDNLLYKTLQKIVDNYTNNCIVLIADQGYADSGKDITIDFYKSQIPLEYYKLPFDSGLAAARNFLIKKVNEKNIPYVLMMADSIQFIQPYDFQSVIDFLEQDNKRGIIGFDLLNSKCPWEFNLEIKNNKLYYTLSELNVQYKDSIYKKVDICRNIFLAKTNTLLDLWDNEMKLCEHTLSFLEYKKRGYEVYWTDSIKFKRVSNHNNIEYETYRKRSQDYKKLLQQKLNINEFVIPKNRK